MRRLLGWMRIGLLDLRGDMKRFGVLIACLALGTGVIATVGSVGTSLKSAIGRDTATLMGGDLEVSRPDRPATQDERAFLESLGETVYFVDSTGRGTTGDKSALLDLVAASDAYPLLGAVKSPELAPGEKPAPLLAEKDGVYGALINSVLLDRLGIPMGGYFEIGNTRFQVRGTVNSLPDGSVRGFQLGLLTLISTKAYASMKDLRAPLPGLLTHYRYKILLSGMDFATAKKAIEDHFADKKWIVRSPRQVASELIRFFDMFTRFLLIVGLSSLLVGGVGVSNGVTAYIGERQQSIAILRSLGATGSRILVHFLTQIGVLIGVGVVIGVATGAFASLVLLPVIGQVLSIDLPSTVQPGPLLSAAGFGLLAGFAYSYLPLMQARHVSPALLFRTLGSVSQRLDWRVAVRPEVFLPAAAAAAGIFALAVFTTGDPILVADYAMGVILAYLILRGAAWGLQVGLKHLPSPPRSDLRRALRNIYAPGSSAPVVIISMGLGLAVMLVIALLDANLHAQLVGQVSKDAPSFVATDLFSDEIDDLKKMRETDPDMVGFQSSPMVRADIVKINGRDPASFKNLPEEASFMLSRAIAVTDARTLPADSRVTDGKWWPADYKGKPLISLRDTMKSELGLKVGDTIEFRLFGDTITATIANFRHFEYQKGLNLMVTFSPGVLTGYPFTNLATIKAAPGRVNALERTLFHTFPEINFIPVGEALNQAAGFVGQIGAAINMVGVIAVINGLLVLAGTMAAGRKQRETNAVIEKVLGATRGNVLRVFLLEYGLLGGFAALIASAVGILTAWAITTRGLEVAFTADPVLIGTVILGAIGLTVAAGGLTTWRALSSRPAQHLRAAA